MYRFFLFFSLQISLANALDTYSLKDGNRVPIDHKLVTLLNARKTRGVFIEVGANDGVTQSNTCLLERHFGWTGVLVEPSKILYNRLCTNRPHSRCFQCALGSFANDNTIAYGDFDSHLMSSIGGTRLNRSTSLPVPIRSLQSILDELHLTHINFFSLDTEGYEYQILQGIDFSKVTFDYLLIEIYSWDYEHICSFLNDRGYTCVECFSNYNHKNSPNWDGTHNDYLFTYNPK